ncbi:MAG: isoprenylcysteine carboxylmethyltransferase family protein [Bdellovibrionales bacterium]
MIGPMSFSRRQKVEIFVRILLAFSFAVMAGLYFQNGSAALGKIDFSNAPAYQTGHALSIFVVGLYAAMVAFLYAIRLPPASRFPGVFPAIASFLGGFLLFALLLLSPREDLPFWAQIFSFLLIISGNGFAVFILSQLGRSFSILPESRRLVTSGAYSIVRHPLYLAEAVAALGVVIIFLSPLAILLFVAQLGWQLIRIHYEEKILKESFPEYEDYAKRTKRLIPWVY